jgi:protein O-GlcNAc transferase
MSMDVSQAFYQESIAYLNQGKIAEAIASLKKSLQIDPNCAAAYQLSGDILQSQGMLSEAIAAFQQAIALLPEGSAETSNKLGLAFIMHGKLEEAIASFQTATDINPESADAHYNLGLALAEQERLEDAIISFRKVLDINPEHIDANLNLSTLLLKQKKLDEAIAYLQDLLAIQPDCADAYYNLGTAFYLQDELDEASLCLEAAIEIEPHHAEAYCLLGKILCGQEQLDEALNFLLRAIEVKPDFAEAHYHIADLLIRQGRIEEAIACCEKAIELRHDYAEAHYLHANALSSSGKTEDAIDSYQKVLDIDPNNAIAYRVQQLILPIIYRTEPEIAWWRQRFVQGMQNLIKRVSLDTKADREWALQAVGESNNFGLTYQAQNDVELQSQYGQLMCRVMSANYPQWAAENWKPQAKSLKLEGIQKIRIGYLSSHFNNHSVTRAIIGWFEHHDHDQFEIYCYHTGEKVDFFTEMLQARSTVFRHINGDLNTICTQLANDGLDILVIADIGMYPQTTQIAALRFAPVQCTCWGHPITSGLPTLDYYISGDLMEPENHQVAQSHYTEELVRLPKLGVSFPKPTLPDQGTRADFRLSEHSVLYLCCQSLIKYLPQHDYIFAAIAQQVPQAHFIFVARPLRGYVAKQFELRLKKAFDSFNLDYQRHCTIFPQMQMDDYLSLSLVSDIFLDTIGFSGGCTSFDAIACNLPIVTQPGEFMRGRHAYAILQATGVTDTIAISESQYIEIAVRLGLDREWRQQISDLIASRHDDVFNDKTCVVALEDFYRQSLRYAKPVLKKF